MCACSVRGLLKRTPQNTHTWISAATTHDNNNNNININDNVNGAIIVTEVIARVQPVHLMNVD